MLTNYPIAKVTPIDLDLLFKWKNLKFYYLGNIESYRNIWNDFKYLVLAAFYFSTVQMNTELFLQICLHLYGIRGRVTLVNCLFLKVCEFNFLRTASICQHRNELIRLQQLLLLAYDVCLLYTVLFTNTCLLTINK